MAHRASRSIIWSDRSGDDLFVRSWRSEGAAWFRSVQDQNLNEQIDRAYRAKYTPVAPTYVEPMLSPLARATTFKLQPR